MAFSRREFLEGLGVGAVAVTGAFGVGRILSPLEALAQSAEREFDMSWKQAGDRYTAKPYSNGIILEQQVDIGNPNYRAVLTYTGKVGKDNQLTDWNVVATLYATSDPSKPESQMSTSGRVETDGRFSLDVWKFTISGRGDISPMVGHCVLTSIKEGTPEQVKYWVTNTTEKYQALAAGQKLGPLP